MKNILASFLAVTFFFALQGNVYAAENAPPKAEAAQPQASEVTPEKVTAPTPAQEAVAAEPQEAQPNDEELLKDVVLHKRPDDFTGAQALALQNRAERLEMLNRSVECVQKATTLEGIYACQTEERKSLDKIWLSYCDTTISFLPGKAKRDGVQKNNKKPKYTECERALSAVTGRALPKKDAPEPVQQGE